MIDIIRDAVQASDAIRSEIMAAIELLETPRRNGLGIYEPRNVEMALRSAREAIDRALVTARNATWPTEADYDAP